jgi:hypothetical protein
MDVIVDGWRYRALTLKFPACVAAPAVCSAPHLKRYVLREAREAKWREIGQTASVRS